MEQFKSGWKRCYYGKGDVIAYRLNRDGKTENGQSPVFGVNAKILLYGDAFWPTYTTGDNTGLIATDSMKNFVQRETMNFASSDLADYCKFLADKFINKYPQVEGIQMSASEIPYSRTSGAAPSFAPGGPEQKTFRLELNRENTVEAVAGFAGFRLLRLGGSAFHGFVRDEYTTLPDVKNRPLHMWLDMEWHYTRPELAFSNSGIQEKVHGIVLEVFNSLESGSIQQIIYQAGQKILAEITEISRVDLEANNRTWDTISEKGDELGVYTDARPPYGCLGLSLVRQ